MALSVAKFVFTASMFYENCKKCRKGKLSECQEFKSWILFFFNVYLLANHFSPDVVNYTDNIYSNLRYQNILSSILQTILACLCE